MKNLSLFVTLGLISLMGAFTSVNAQDAPLEIVPQAQEDVDASEVIYDDQGNIIDKDEVDGVVEIPTGEESAEFIEPVEEPTPVE